MSETEQPYEAYVYALREQAEQHLAGLEELSSLADRRPLSFNERNAAERGLQVLVEKPCLPSASTARLRFTWMPSRKHCSTKSREPQQSQLTRSPVSRL